MADGVLQREELPGTKIMPYVLAGVGAVEVHDKGSDSTFGYSKTQNDLLWQAGLTVKL